MIAEMNAEHGIVLLIHAGETAPADDLRIAIWTAEQADVSDLRIHQRLADGYYDRVFWMFPLELKIQREIDRYYGTVEHIPGPDYGRYSDHRGVQPYLTAGCDALVRREPRQ